MPKMFTTTQLEIIKLFGRKDLKEGCVVYIWKNVHFPEWVQKVVYSDWYWIWLSNWHMQVDTSMVKEILWHIPHLEDVFRVAWEIWAYTSIDNFEETLSFRKSRYQELEEIPFNPTLPLLEQSEEILTQLINIFSKI